jgi:hypothetical protein
MLGTDLTIDMLVESLGGSLKRQLKRIGLTFCNNDVSDLIITNLNYPLKYTPTLFSFFMHFRNYFSTNCVQPERVMAGQRVTYTNHKGTLHLDAVILSAIGNKVKICEISSPPALSLVGNNKSKKVLITTNEKDKNIYVDISRLKSPELCETYFIFDTNPVMEDAIIKIPVEVIRWRLS